MDGKVVNLIPSNLSKGGIFTSTAASAIKSLGSNLGNPPLAVQSFNETLTTTTSSYPSLTHTFDVTKSGYTPLGIIGFRTTSAGFSFVQRYVSGNNCVVRLFCDANNVPTGTNVTAYVWILYMKD